MGVQYKERKPKVVCADTSIRTVQERNALVEKNLALPGFVVKRYFRGGNGSIARRMGGQEELFAAGTIGLIRAAETWREDGGSAFATWAIRWIRRDILRAMRKASLVHVPEHIATYPKWRDDPATAELVRRANRVLLLGCEDFARQLSYEEPALREIEVRDALERIAPEHREVLWLHHGIGMSLRKIEDRLGLGRNKGSRHARVAMSAARKSLGLERAPLSAQERRIVAALDERGLTPTQLAHKLGMKRPSMLLHDLLKEMAGDGLVRCHERIGAGVGGFRPMIWELTK